MTVRCGNCGHTKIINVEAGFHGFTVPRACDNMKNPGPDKTQCKMDSY